MIRLGYMRNAVQAQWRARFYDLALPLAVKGVVDSLADEDEVSIQVSRCTSEDISPGRLRWSIEIEEPIERVHSHIKQSCNSFAS